MNAAPPFLPDILEEHLEELEFLRARWLDAVAAPDHTLGDVAYIERRIEAHVAGVRVAGPGARPLLEEALAAEDPGMAFAGARGLLALGPDGGVPVLAAFSRAEGERLDALGQALAWGAPGEATEQGLARLLDGSGGERAAAAAVVLAHRGTLELEGRRIEAFVADEDESVALRGWRLVAWTGMAVDPKRFAAAVRDGSPELRVQALEAGAWCHVAGTRDVARHLLGAEDPPSLGVGEILAVLGGPEDRELLLALVRNASLGPERFAVAASAAHASFVPVLLEAMAGEDDFDADGAARAFERMTGTMLPRVPRPDGARAAEQTIDDGGPEGDGAVEGREEADLDEVDDPPLRPDVEAARPVWEALRPTLGADARLVGGVDADRSLDAPTFARLDMRTRRQMYMRSRFLRAWNGSPIVFERFPQGDPG